MMVTKDNALDYGRIQNMSLEKRFLSLVRNTEPLPYPDCVETLQELVREYPQAMPQILRFVSKAKTVGALSKLGEKLPSELSPEVVSQPLFENWEKIMCILTHYLECLGPLLFASCIEELKVISAPKGRIN